MTRPTLCLDDHMDWHVARPSLVRTSSLDPVARVSSKILDCISRAIITHFAKSIRNKTFLGLFRWTTTTCPTPPAEWKDKSDGKSSPPAISVSRLQDNDGSATLWAPSWQPKSKSLPTIQRDEALSTIKWPSTTKSREGRYAFQRKRAPKMLISRC